MHRSVVLFIAVMLMTLPLAALAQESTPVATPVSLSGVAPLPLTSERQAELAEYIAGILEKSGIPGAAVAVVQGGDVAYQQGFGVRELGQPAPVTPDTLMMIGSITKSMTSTMAATVVDDGELTWETPVRDLLPDFAVADPALTQSLTIRNAFCACTGLPQRDGAFIFNSDAYTPEMLIASVADMPLTAPLGELYQYSNQMFAIGGYAATVAAGGSSADLYAAYTDAMRQRLLAPMGMERSTFALADVIASEDYAVPHGPDLTGAVETIALEDEDSFVTSVAPAGALWSSAAEMSRYLQTELAAGVAPDGTRVVSEQNLHATWEQQVPIPDDWSIPPEMGNLAEGYGLGWVLGDYFGQPLLWHNGGTFGFSSLMAFLPEADLGIVVLTNVAGADFVTWAIQYYLLEMLFAQPHGVDAVIDQLLAQMAEQRAGLSAMLANVDAEAVAPYLGVYENDELGAVTTALADGALTLDSGELQSGLTPVRDESGEVTAYFLADPPLAGVAVTFSMEDDVPVMRFADPETGEEFVFRAEPAH